ncbi:MAG: Na+/H+ antiporter subunit E [Thiohalocapsa sp.]
MRNILILTVLSVFWLLLSGHYTPLLLALGLASVLLVVWFQRRMDRIDQEPIRLRPSFGLLLYFGWLFWSVIKANIDLARRIWDPKLPVEPLWTRLDTQVTTPLEKTLYANSITLTPGTLTTDVRDDHFMIHALSQEGIEELREGEMERRIRRLGL